MIPDGPDPVAELVPPPEATPTLEKPEKDPDALGNFAETIIDADGELEPDVLDEPPEPDSIPV